MKRAQPGEMAIASERSGHKSSVERYLHMATSTATRIHNFSAGPAVLPVDVLEQAQRDLELAHAQLDGLVNDIAFLEQGARTLIRGRA